MWTTTRYSTGLFLSIDVNRLIRISVNRFSVPFYSLLEHCSSGISIQPVSWLIDFCSIFRRTRTSIHHSVTRFAINRDTHRSERFRFHVPILLAKYSLFSEDGRPWIDVSGPETINPIDDLSRLSRVTIPYFNFGTIYSGHLWKLDLHQTLRTLFQGKDYRPSPTWPPPHLFSLVLP